MATVIESSDSKSSLSKVYGGKQYSPVGVTSVSMNDGDGASELGGGDVRGDPGLSEDADTLGIGEGGGGVCDGVVRVELVGAELTEGAVLVGLSDWMNHCCSLFAVRWRREEKKGEEVLICLLDSDCMNLIYKLVFFLSEYI